MKLRLLLVDDSVDFVKVMERSISLDPAWEFRSCTKPRRVLEEVRSLKPDVVVLDYDLGEADMTGFDLLARLRADEQLRHTPVLMLTGRAPELDDRIEGFSLGADDYLIKPVRVPLLLARARAAVDKAQRGLRHL